MKAILIFAVGLVLGVAIRPAFESPTASDGVGMTASAPIRQGTRVEDQMVIPQGKDSAAVLNETPSEGAELGYPIELPKN